MATDQKTYTGFAQLTKEQATSPLTIEDWYTEHMPEPVQATQDGFEQSGKLTDIVTSSKPKKKFKSFIGFYENREAVMGDWLENEGRKHR